MLDSLVISLIQHVPWRQAEVLKMVHCIYQIIAGQWRCTPKSRFDTGIEFEAIRMTTPGIWPYLNDVLLVDLNHLILIIDEHIVVVTSNINVVNSKSSGHHL